MEIIREQHTEENPLIIKNYPYGFKKTQMRIYIESVKGKGDRVIRQTQNPKTLVWNNPKKSTYNGVFVLYREENGHIQSLGLYPSTDENEYKEFMEKVGDYPFNELQEKFLRWLRANIKVYANVTHSIRVKRYRNLKTGEIVEQVPLMSIGDYEEITDEEEDEEQRKTQETINKGVAMEYHKDEGIL